MRNQVTVIPQDKMIIVDGRVLVFDFVAPDNLYAMQWNKNAGHMEWLDKDNTILTSDDYASYVEPYVNLWENEKSRIEEENKKFEEEYNSLANVKKRKILAIDQETSAKILQGFDYKLGDTAYHFSYDTFDQQNFVDTASMCQLAISNMSEVPASVVWNSYLSDGSLVQQEFDAHTFLDLYVNGAMQHKATQMALGGQRKAAVEVAKTVEEVDSI